MMLKGDIGPLKERHVGQIAAIERICFSQPWSEDTIRQELHTPLSRYLVYEEQGEVLGYVGTRMVLGECYITNVAVHLKARRRGIATLLLERLESVARKEGMDIITLEVRESNSGARAFYEKMGFERVGLRPGYYQEPEEPAVLMTKFLSKGRKDG